ncbi:MAG: UDP-3-O-(3-hydroxymyristoyl)glucosamine N-acyltransferase [Thiohalocapsa sp.]|jgi:UDP-3-O-[3-hydroxymyristoyl] glucosamine N-acyltransferase|uniref:UDP-3-O-(3-hydroxymyristoyl)glucosamine N-acyltransferase n=1 Tax=Thiohalocapsa sp. TaxID=2497641 RepID=UPI0025DC8B61|nr:UDP-3-O-(3-hydroxymyristoyl)glucosamine N-acyltransferase [Thiohalocapsa sp.]MCG6943324.1 UDP-3-O-(3-hydroxymyristoyl)glucosamine N-acyltransferase [Thiohalocapsa sp.]
MSGDSAGRRCDGEVMTAGRLAAELGLALVGADVPLSRVAPLHAADASCLSFLVDRRYRPRLADTRAGAVILRQADADAAPCTVLVADNPELAFAKAAAMLHPRPRPPAGVHPTAVVDDSASIDPTASIGPLCVLEAGVRVAAGVEIGPHCSIGAGTSIGAETRLVAKVTICAGAVIGARVLLHPGSVIGREGFGFARDGERWVRIPQVGGVRLGDDVEIGANSTVDRGAIEDTIIADGVKIDNLVQIGHNVSIGENTAMAACSGISGSTRIGARCTVAGAVGMAGHLHIADDVHFTGMAMVTRSQSEAGVYSSGIPAMPNAEWRRTIGRLRRLESLQQRVQQLERALAEPETGGAQPPAD